MLYFEETRTQVFGKEEDDRRRKALASADEEGVSSSAVGDGYAYSMRLWGSSGGWWGVTCRFCALEDDKFLSSPELETIGDTLGSTRIGEEMCAMLRPSGSEIFSNVHDCSVPAKPGALSLVKKLREQNLAFHVVAQE